MTHRRRSAEHLSHVRLQNHNGCAFLIGGLWILLSRSHLDLNLPVKSFGNAIQHRQRVAIVIRIFQAADH